MTSPVATAIIVNNMGPRHSSSLPARMDAIARPSEQLDLWAVRLVSPLADSACSRNRPSSQLQQGWTMSPDPTVVRSSLTCGQTTR